MRRLKVRSPIGLLNDGKAITPHFKAHLSVAVILRVWITSLAKMLIFLSPNISEGKKHMNHSLSSLTEGIMSLIQTL